MASDGGVFEKNNLKDKFIKFLSQMWIMNIHGNYIDVFWPFSAIYKYQTAFRDHLHKMLCIMMNEILAVKILTFSVNLALKDVIFKS